jgi:hypothetical protein
VKQHLAFEDLEKFSRKEQIDIATLFGQYGNCCNTGGESINIGLLRGKITIGAMIDVLTKQKDYIEISGPYDEGFFPWAVTTPSREYVGNELCDTLWDAVLDLR